MTPKDLLDEYDKGDREKKKKWSLRLKVIVKKMIFCIDFYSEGNPVIIRVYECTPKSLEFVLRRFY